MKIVRRKKLIILKFDDVNDRNRCIKALVRHLMETPGYTKVALNWPDGMTQADILRVLRSLK